MNITAALERISDAPKLWFHSRYLLLFHRRLKDNCSSTSEMYKKGTFIIVSIIRAHYEDRLSSEKLWESSIICASVKLWLRIWWDESLLFFCFGPERGRAKSKKKERKDERESRMRWGERGKKAENKMQRGGKLSWQDMGKESKEEKQEGED